MFEKMPTIIIYLKSQEERDRLYDQMENLGILEYGKKQETTQIKLQPTSSDILLEQTSFLNDGGWNFRTLGGSGLTSNYTKKDLDIE